ncbi:TrbM/KikA/MpfK family conjugal transfer protein [Orbus sturtevantii]|uniref:TrbM/KikA/MpfK family conjugal transfer protein n=1 Tax=Orbus sturtevantii TaxID=3074109 RepID=UPI00370D484B
MMKKLIGFLSLAMIVTANSAYAENNNNELTGDTKLACEALLCLSSSTRPTECAASLARYFGIKDPKKWAKTVIKRKNFLKLCPTSDDNQINPIVENIIDDVTPIRTDCTAEEFNKLVEKTIRRERSEDGIVSTTYYRTKTTVPDYCENLAKKSYLDVKLPTYSCSGNYYKDEDWKNGFYTARGQNGKVQKFEIAKNCWVN